MSAHDEFKQAEAIHRDQDGPKSDEISSIIPVAKGTDTTTPDGPLSNDVYVKRLQGKELIPDLYTWSKSIENRKIRRQKSRLLSNGLCQRCHEIATKDLEWLKSSGLEDSQAAVIRLSNANKNCKGCSFFACCRLTGTHSDSTTYYFLASLPARHFGVDLADCRLWVVTSNPYAQINPFQLRRWKNNQRCMLQFDTTCLPEDEIRHLPFGRNEYESIAQWLNDCITNHAEQCPQTALRKLSTLYCIDCENERVVLMPENAKYFALSYVWGHAKAPDEDESLSNAPTVIKDAMRVTLRLRFRYLWVDRYCIDQHDANQKHQQIANMGNIYAGATLTLVAAGSTGPGVGLPGVSSCQCNLDAAFHLGSFSYVPLFGNPKVAIESFKWSTRGWTYQETVMSLRKLVFTADGFFAQCNMQHSFGSSHPIGGQSLVTRKMNIETTGVFPDGTKQLGIAPTVVFPGTYSEKPIDITRGVIDEFFEHISNYVRRDLSYESDRLNAIQGVLNEFRTSKDPLFQVFGLPLKPDTGLTINSALFWRMENDRVRRRTDFPSWSWLGWQYNDEIPRQPVILCDLEDKAIGGRYFYHSYGTHIDLDEHSARISVELSGGRLLNLTENPLSGVTLDTQLPREARIMPSLVIRGVIFPLIFEENEIGNWARVGAPSRPFYRNSYLFSLHFSMWLDVPYVEEEGAFRRNQLKALVLGLAGASIHVLIIKKKGDGWTRIGIAQYSRQLPIEDLDWFFRGLKAVKKVYFKTMKRYRKRTIRLT